MENILKKGSVVMSGEKGVLSLKIGLILLMMVAIALFGFCEKTELVQQKADSVISKIIEE